VIRIKGAGLSGGGSYSLSGIQQLQSAAEARIFVAELARAAKSRQDIKLVKCYRGRKIFIEPNIFPLQS
jgi:hypothetical protein